MSDIRREGRQRELKLLRKHQESNSMLAIVMAGIAGLFILAVAAAYHYAFDPGAAGNQNLATTASRPSAPSGSMAPRGTTGPATTGSGITERGPQ